MKILNVNKFYYLKGGCETYYFSLTELLKQNGINVVPFSLKHEKNFQTKYEKFFIDPIDYTNPTLKQKFIYASKIIYSIEARRKIKKLLHYERPDIAHIHIFQHQISPSILPVLRKQRIPVVHTVHDLKILCPNYKMLIGNKICERCKNHKYINCLLNKCVKNSRLGSLVNTIEMYLHYWLKSYENNVDIFITPSKFFKQKFIEYGFQSKKIRYIPNYVDIENFEPNYNSQDYFIYLGRLSDEKGIQVLLEAMKNVKMSKLLIVGTGPLEDELKEIIQKNSLKNVELVGYKTGKELETIIKNCKFVVVPSICYENCPYSILEANAFGKPVVGSNIGGIPELIEDGITGLVFNPGDPRDLAEKLNFLLAAPDILPKMGKTARNRVEKHHNKDLHFKILNTIYDELLGIKKTF